ncbi:FAD-binding and (Fe-S)-binding domain-containing protein [Pontibacter beigongshangensis]|uniref:FAD-binding and (Fe-S)-binding domain-containing protein n=1 Tax=Pontibacter beigongshangensis TaxID=2574733 RepID=UPI00164FFF3C|nr:FAD-binding and (Fe-S)-binding domain-containing protein [Pontibacter beigongshangensis]
MNSAPHPSAFAEIAAQLQGEFYFDNSSLHESQKRIYATDASVYQEQPLAVAIPKTAADIEALIQFANRHRLSLIPRAAGTSLAGQVVGNGMVVDISRYMTQVLEVNVQERWVRVQPGVIRDDLNAFLRPHGLMFGPETSTANRAMIGGMIGNNSCGLHSIVWGDTREHLLSAKVLLSDGTETEFRPLSAEEVAAKCKLTTVEGDIYREVSEIVRNDANRAVIEKNYPKATLTRRNTGYALDILVANAVAAGTDALNLCNLLAGSEGTLAFVTEAKLNLMPLPPKEEGLVCIHCSSLPEALLVNLVALKHQPMASELVDDYILGFTKGHPVYQYNRFFIEGEPAALLMVEFMADTQKEITAMANALVTDLKEAGLGYAYPLVRGAQTKLAWDVRKAGLGLIRNLPGDYQPVNLIEDCAVSPEDLPAYIADLQVILEKYKLNASYYAHAGAGELHVEPMINLKTSEGKELFRTVLHDTALLVKKYNGSLSGEHGDGRLRGEFISTVLGEEVYTLLKRVKLAFDPKSIFNANKIVNTPPMNEQLRYEPDKQVIPVVTLFDFTRQEGILRLAEKCSGSGDCRKTHISGGTMCPSYMATRQEKDTTRARANILRQFLTSSPKENRFDHEEIKEVMDLCLSCKACKSECPSSVDVAKMKAEFLQHYYEANGVPFRTWMIGNFTKSQQLASLFPQLYNYVINNSVTSNLVKKMIGFAPDRSLPKVGNTTLRSWKKKWDKERKASGREQQLARQVILFCDEFTNYNDVEIGKTTVQLLTALGYEVLMPDHLESGRTYLSKGLVKKAKEIANANVQQLAKVVQPGVPLIGIEPSAILTFRDEYPDLVSPELLPDAQFLASNSFLLEEFLVQEAEKGHISAGQFTDKPQLIKLHGHCYQKALNALVPTHKILSLPENYVVEQIPSGCCGMAGSFGYEKEHFDVSMKIGGLVLFPAVEAQAPDTLIAAAGTSCRHQIKDGTTREALHPAEILWLALKEQTA